MRSPRTSSTPPTPLRASARARPASARHAVIVETAGMPAFIMAAQVGVKRDMELMDTVSLPLALPSSSLMLRSARLLLLPILNIGVVAGFGFALMYPISLHMSVGSTVPSLMVSVAIATSIDYSSSSSRASARRSSAAAARSPPSSS